MSPTPFAAVHAHSPGRDDVLSRVRERIVSFAASRLSRDVAEDIAQDTLVLLTTKYADKTAIEDLVPLAFRIVRLKMMAYRRKVVRRGEHRQESLDSFEVSTPPELSTADSPERELERRQLRERLLTAARALTGRCRELFRLKLDGLAFPEIQRRMGARSVNTVYTWDSRCRETLRRLMQGSWEF